MRRFPQTVPRTPNIGRPGITILEVLLAVSILLAAMAAIGHLIATGTRASAHAQLQTEAILHCESKLAKIIAGIEPMQSADSVAIEDGLNKDDKGWFWSLDVHTREESDLLSLDVTTWHTMQDGTINARFTLGRIVRDPEVYVDAAFAESMEPAE